MIPKFFKLRNLGDGYLDIPDSRYPKSGSYWYTLRVEFHEYCVQNNLQEFDLSRIMDTFSYFGYLVFVIYSYSDFFESFFKKHHIDYKSCLLSDE